MASWRDEFELLCERCGYSIEGLPASTNCPECAEPVAASLPESRPGSAWQRSRGAAAWGRTVLDLLRRPGRTIRSVRIEAERSARFRRVNVLLAAAILTVVPALTYAVQTVRHQAPYSVRDLTWPWAESALRWAGLAIVLLVWWAGLTLALSLMTSVETWGIRTFGRVHGKRITRTVARTITAHATAGWVAAAVFVSGGFALGMLLYEVTNHRNVEPFRGVMMLSPIWMPTILGLIGLLAFESIVYLGVLRCKFANRERDRGTARAAAPEELADP